MKIRIDDIPQNISIKEIVLDIQVNDNSFKVQSTTFANSENLANTVNAAGVASVSKVVSKSASVSDIKDEIQNIDLKASAEIPEEMNEQF